MRKKKIFRMCCFAFLGLLFVISRSWAVSVDSGQINNNLKSANVEQLLKLEIPSGWGIIKDSYDSGTDKLVINIQDAHCDFEAQKNISNILDRLAANYNLKLITLEGASGNVENPILANFPDKKVKKNVSLYMVKQGRLTGAEYFAVNSDYALKLYGVEDIRLYMDNLAAFKQAQPFKAEAVKYLAVLKNSLDVLKPYIYNDNLKKLDILENDYALKRISFDKYAVELYKTMEDNGLRKVNYPTFYELQNAIKLESKVDFEKADAERMELITTLTQLIDDKQTISNLIEKSLNFKRGMLSAGEFANFLKDMAFDMKLNMGAYPNFNAYAEYITKYEQIANEKLFAEIEDIKQNLKKVFYTDDDQKQLDVSYRNLSILVKLVDLKMVNEDIAYFFKNRDQINMENFTKFIEPQAYKHKLTVLLPAQISLIDIYIPAWAKFYELADTRDSVFIEKTLEKMDSEKADYAALITGGFHTKQLTDILKQKKISYLIIAPKASVNDSNPYFSIMQGDKSVIQRFVSQMQSTLQPLTMSFDDESVAKLSASEQKDLAQSQDAKKSDILISTAVEEFAAIAETSPAGTKDQAIRDQVVAKFQAEVNAGVTGIDMNQVKDVVAKISSEGSVVQFKDEKQSAAGAALVYNPQSGIGDTFTIVSPEDVQVMASAPKNETFGQAGRASIPAALSINDIGISASPKDVLSAVLNTSAEKNSPVSSESVGSAFIVEAVVGDLATTGVVDSKSVANKLKSDHPQLFSRAIRLDQQVADVVDTTVAVTMQSSPLTDKAADIAVGEKGLNVPTAKQDTAKQTIKNNIADVKAMSTQLNKDGIKVTESQVTAALNTGLSETAKSSANSGEITAKVVVAKLGISNENQKKLAAEIVRNSDTSNAEIITTKLNNAGINVDKTKVANALNKGLLQANAAAQPIISGISGTSTLAKKEQEVLIADQVKPADISNIQNKSAALSGTSKEQQLVFKADKADPKILKIAENAGVSKDKISSVVIAAGDYSELESVSVELKPSASTKGNVSIVISPKKTDIQTSEAKTMAMSMYNSIQDQNDVLANKGKALATTAIAYQDKMLNEDLAKAQATNLEDPAKADTAPKIKEKNVIVFSTDTLGEPDFNAVEAAGIPVEIKGMASPDMWNKMSENNDIVIMNPKGLNVSEFSKAVGLPEDNKVIFVSPSDVKEMVGEESSASTEVTPRATYQVLERRGTKMKNICYITEKGSEINKAANKMVNDPEIDASVAVATYPKAQKGQVLDLNMCFTQAVNIFISGKGGQMSQAEKDEYKFLIKSYMGDKQLKITISDDEFDGLFSKEIDSTSMFVVKDIPKAFMNENAALEKA